jgi:hypothetical protein
LETKSKNNLILDYATFNEYKSHDLNIDIPEYVSKIENKRDRLESTLNVINEELNSDLVLNQIDLDLASSIIEISSAIDYSLYLNETDIELMHLFEEDLMTMPFNIAIENFEDRVKNLNLTKDEFSKYNDFLNVILLVYNNLNSTNKCNF